MKRIFCLSLAAASLLATTAYADDIEDSQNSAIEPAAVESEAVESEAVESEAVESEAVEPAPAASEVRASGFSIPARQYGWGQALAVYVGVGPAADMLDPCYGYSARIGVEYHEKYWGIGLEVTWNTVWSTASGSRPNHRRDFADKTSNSGIMLFGHGYLPTSERFVLSLGAGIGFVGARYEDFSDNPEEKRTSSMMDGSWLAQFQTGAMWLVTDHITLGFDLELNLGNYWSELPRWNSDDEMDISLGAIFTFSYQFFIH